MKLPKISIITPTYNSARYIKDCIIGVLKQTYLNWEMIIINDYSSDNTSKIVKPFLKESRIKYSENKENLGLVRNLNNGLRLSISDFIARLDSDDVWIDKKKLEKQVNYLIENPETVLVGTWGYRLNPKGKRSKTLKYPEENNQIKKYLLIENCFLHSSVVFRKSSALQVGGYDDKYKHAEDYALWLKMGQEGIIHNLPEFTVGYRVNNKGISFTKYKDQISSTIKAIQAYRNNYPFYYLALTLWYTRRIIPRSLRENLSGLFRTLILYLFSKKAINR